MSRIRVDWAEEESHIDLLQEEREDDEASNTLTEHSSSSECNSGDEQSDWELEAEENEKYFKSEIRPSTFMGRDKSTEWWADAERKAETKKHNTISRLPGVKASAKDANSILQCWHLFFTDELLTEVVNFTNIFLDKVRSSYERERDVRPTTLIEIKCLLGLLYMTGSNRANHLNLKELWLSDGTAPDIFRASMSLKRFYLLLTAIRFDDVRTRQERAELDRLAPIRDFFDYLNDRCGACYTPGQYVVADEMLEGFRGRCKFRQYVPSKPAKYGIKIYALVDSSRFYTVKMEIYAGKQPPGPYQLDETPHSLVKRLTEPILHTGRNITMDDRFASVSLALDLLTNYNTTIVGALRRNERAIPPEFSDARKRKVYSSLFAFTDRCTLVSYVPKKGKNVLMLSTFHHTGDIDKASGIRAKPEILSFYNLTKEGVDAVDELKGNYSVNRETRRWPMIIFYSMLNIVGINSQIIYRENTQRKISRRAYLHELAKSLILPYMKIRLSEPSLSFELRSLIRRIGQFETEKQDIARGFCAFCPRRENKRTKKMCESCAKYVCPKHTLHYCIYCRNSEEKLINPDD